MPVTVPVPATAKLNVPTRQERSSCRSRPGDAASWRTLAIQRGLVLQGRRLYTTRTSAVVEESAFLFDAVVWSVPLRSDDVGGMRAASRSLRSSVDDFTTRTLFEFEFTTRNYSNPKQGRQHYLGYVRTCGTTWCRSETPRAARPIPARNVVRILNWRFPFVHRVTLARRRGHTTTSSSWLPGRTTRSLCSHELYLQKGFSIRNGD